MLDTKRRFLMAGVILFLCMFCQTLLQYNATFALGGMVSLIFSFLHVFQDHNYLGIPGQPHLG